MDSAIEPCSLAFSYQFARVEFLFKATKRDSILFFLLSHRYYCNFLFVAQEVFGLDLGMCVTLESECKKLLNYSTIR